MNTPQHDPILTPRTDAALCPDIRDWSEGISNTVVTAAFARTLEREVARLRAALETCKKTSCTRYDRFGYGYDSWEQVFDEAKVAAALINPASHELARELIVGKLIIAGDMVIHDERLTGLFIEMTEEALRAVKHLPMYEDVALVPLAVAP